MCDVCSGFLNLLISYESRFNSGNDTDQPVFLQKREVETVLNYIQTWPNRQCMCCYRDVKNFERFNLVIQGLICFTVYQLKNIRKLLAQNQLQASASSGQSSSGAPETVSSENDPSKEVSKAESATEHNDGRGQCHIQSTNKPGQGKAEPSPKDGTVSVESDKKRASRSSVESDTAFDNSERQQQQLTSANNQPGLEEVWTLLDVEKLLILVSKVFLLNFPLYVAYKHGVHTRMEEVSPQEVQSLSLFCDLHENEISAFLLRNVSLFCNYAGFEAMMHCFDQPGLPVSTAHAITAASSNIKLWINYRSTVQLFIPLRVKVLQYMCRLSDQDLRSPATKSMADFMWTAIKDPFDSQITFDTEGLALAFKYFTSSTLTMRLAGMAQINAHINMFNDICTSETVSEVEAVGMKLANWLTENQIISHLFGPNLHVEVIKQSHIVLNFLAVENQITEEHITLMWQAAQLKHCSKTIYDILPSLVKNLAPKPATHLYSLLCRLDPKEHTEQSIYIASALTKLIWMRDCSRQTLIDMSKSTGATINDIETGRGDYNELPSSSENSVSVDGTNSEDEHPEDDSSDPDAPTVAPAVVSSGHKPTGSMLTMGPDRERESDNGAPPCKQARHKICCDETADADAADHDGSCSSPMSNKSEKNMADFDDEDSPCEEELAQLAARAESLHQGFPLPRPRSIGSVAGPSPLRAVGATGMGLMKHSPGLHCMVGSNNGALKIGKGASTKTKDILQATAMAAASAGPVSNMMIGTPYRFPDVCQPGNTLLWDLLQDDKIGQLGESIAVEAEKVFGTLLCFHTDKHIRTRFIEGCLQNLAENRSVVTSLKLLPKLFASFQQFRDVTTHQVVLWSERQHRMMFHFFNNLKHYAATVRGGGAQSVPSETAGPSDVTTSPLYTHVTQIQVRLQFLTSVFSDVGSPRSFRLTLNQVDSLWACLANDSECSDCLFSWLQAQVKGGDTHALGLNAIQHLYMKRLSELKPEGISMVALGLFQQLFTLGREELFGQSMEGGEQQQRDRETDTVGMEHLWKIALRATNTDVSLSAIQYINTYYMEKQLKYEHQFVAQCMNHLSQAVEELNQHSDNNGPATEYALLCVQRALMLLNTHLDTFRRRYAYHLRRWALEGQEIGTHSALRSEGPGPPIRIVVQPAGVPDKSFLNMHASDLVADLKAEIAKWWEKMQTAPQTKGAASTGNVSTSSSEPNSTSAGSPAPVLGLLLNDGPLRIITQGQEITSEYDERSLADVGFKDNQMVYVSLGGRSGRRREQSENLAMQSPPSKDCLPTLLLLKPPYFEQLFRLMQTLGDMKISTMGERCQPNTKAQLLSRRVWDILAMLPTCPSFFSTLKNLSFKEKERENAGDSNPSEQVAKETDPVLGGCYTLEEILDPYNLQKFMYALHIVESLCKSKFVGNACGSAPGGTGAAATRVKGTIPFTEGSSNRASVGIAGSSSKTLSVKNQLKLKISSSKSLKMQQQSCPVSAGSGSSKSPSKGKRLDFAPTSPGGSGIVKPTPLSSDDDRLIALPGEKEKETKCLENKENISFTGKQDCEQRLDETHQQIEGELKEPRTGSVENTLQQNTGRGVEDSKKQADDLNESGIASTSTQRGVVEWSDEFMRCGGLEHLYRIFLSGALQKSACGSDESELDEWRHDCLASLLRILCLLGMDEIKSTESEGNAILIPPLNRETLALFETRPTLERIASILNEESLPVNPNLFKTGLFGRPQVIHYAMNLLVCYAHSCKEVRHMLWMIDANSYWLQRLILDDPEPAVRREACAALYRLCLGNAQTYYELMAPLLSKLVALLPQAENMKPQSLIGTAGAAGLYGALLAAGDEGKEPYGPACRDYFWLLCRLVDALSPELLRGNAGIDDELHPRDAIGLDTMCQQVARSILDRDYLESRHGSPDDGLFGLLNLMANLLKFDPAFKYSVVGQEFMISVFCCLFELPSPEDREKPKCKSHAARAAAYDLLVEMCRNAPKNYLVLHGKLMQQHRAGPHSPYPWDYWPQDEGRSECGYVGLTNLGATCYMASCIQHLFMTPQTRDAILSISTDAPQKHKATLVELQRMFAYLMESERKAYCPRSFCRVYQMDHQPLNTGEQKDMAEFFIDLVSKLEEMTPELKSLVKRIFCGVISNNVVSLDCGHVSRTLEEFYTVRCQVADMRNLHESLDEVTVKDTLEGDNMYTCSQCGKKVRAEKRACFKKLPQILCFNTMRYTFNMVTMLKEKVNTHFSFPMRLDMSGYVEKTLMPHHYQEEKRKSQMRRSNSRNERNEDGDPNHQERWFLFNDAEVKLFDSSQIAAECFGGEMTNTVDSIITATRRGTDGNQSGQSGTNDSLTCQYSFTVSSVYCFDTLHPLIVPLAGSSMASSSPSTSCMGVSGTTPPSVMAFQAATSSAASAAMLHGVVSEPSPSSYSSISSLSALTATVGGNIALPMAAVVGSTPVGSAGSFTAAASHVVLQSSSSSSSSASPGCSSGSASGSNSTGMVMVNRISHSNKRLRHRPLSKELEEWIWQDNRHFLQDRNIFEHTYFKQSHCSLYLKAETDIDGNEIIGNVSCVTRFIKSLIMLMEHGAKAHSRHLSEFFSLLYEFSRMGEEEALFLLRINVIRSVADFYLGHKGQECVDANSDNEENSSDEALTVDKSRPASLDKMIALVASLVERSRGPDLRLHLSARDYNAIAGGKGFPFLYQQIKDNINPQQTRHLIHALCRCDERLAGQIIAMLFTAVTKHTELCGPFFKLITLLTESSGGPPGLPCFSQLVLQRVWDAAEYCPQSALDWLAVQAPRNKIVHNWILQSADSWVERFLLAHGNARVRNAAAYLLVCLVPSQSFRNNYRATSHFKLSIHVFQQREISCEAQLILHTILNLLLLLLRSSRNYTDINVHGTSKLTAYFNLLTYCLVSKTEKLMVGPHLKALWDLFHPRLSEPAVPAHHNKQALLAFWYQATLDCPENASLVANCPDITRNIAFNYILADHDDTEIVTYNRAMLPVYYGLLRMCCQQSRLLTRQLAAHQNLQWAFKNITPHPTQYPLAVDELFRLMTLFAQRHPDASEVEQRDVTIFRRTTLTAYLNGLDARVSWGTLIAALRILVENDDDRLYVVLNGGITLCFDALHTLHSMYHEATACHVFGDLQELLTEVILLISTLRASSREQKKRPQPTLMKGLPDAIRRLATLLNTFNPPEMRNLALEVLKELVKCAPPDIITTVLVPLLTSCHAPHIHHIIQQSNSTSSAATAATSSSAASAGTSTFGPLGSYFPRRGVKAAWPPVSKNTPRPPKAMIQMNIPQSQICEKGLDKDFDLALELFYRPYHEFLDIVFRVAVTSNHFTEPLVHLSLLTGIEAVVLHFNIFAKFWVGIYNNKTTHRYAEMLIKNPLLIDYIDNILRDERLSLNDPIIANFIEIYYPKIKSRLVVPRLLESICQLLPEKNNLEDICGDLQAIRIIGQRTGIPSTAKAALQHSLHAVLLKFKDEIQSDESREQNTTKGTEVGECSTKPIGPSVTEAKPTNDQNQKQQEQYLRNLVKDIESHIELIFECLDDDDGNNGDNVVQQQYEQQDERQDEVRTKVAASTTSSEDVEDDNDELFIVDSSSNSKAAETATTSLSDSAARQKLREDSPSHRPIKIAKKTVVRDTKSLTEAPTGELDSHCQEEKKSGDSATSDG
uniref:ubiquitinyl hydrolase 1 n=1 Tax=Anopheles farauti TaxID=69004 RepID=A0A182R156_9DIPT